MTQRALLTQRGRRRQRRLRGLKALLHDAVDLTTELVADGFESTARTVKRVAGLVEPLAGPVEAIDALRQASTVGVLGTVRVVNQAVRVVSDLGLELAESLADARVDVQADVQADVRADVQADVQAAASADEATAAEPALPMRSDALDSAAWLGDAALGLVNAVVGDHLHRRDNGLGLEMKFRLRDHYVPLTGAALTRLLPAASPRVALFVHGLGTTEWSWCLAAAAYHGDPAASFGTLLERDLGYTPVWLRYNTGRHISENGRQLAAELERFIAAYPVPIEELVLVGHSMGGLVVRSACHYASEQRLGWLAHVRRVFCLGSPHRGAPLAKLGQVLTSVLRAIDLPATRIPGRLLAGRSAGIKDLRHGALIDEDWLGRDPDALAAAEPCAVALLPQVTYYFVSATVTADPGHPLGRLIGDLLVRLPSSSGPLTRAGTFAIETRRFGGVMHHQLQNHPAVYEVLRAACAGAPAPV